MDWYIPEEEQLPDLSHWKPLSEFTIAQAALLLAGVDPVEFTIEQVVNQRLPRWKYAATYEKAIVAAIRQGLIQPVYCAYVDSDSFGESVLEMKASDRKKDMSIHHTIISRNTLESWVTREKVQPISIILYKRAKGLDSTADHNQVNNPEQDVPTSSEEYEVGKAQILLPKYEHTSDGLVYVEMAVRHFWSTWDEDDPSTIPDKKSVIDYLKSQGATLNLAEAADKVCRPSSTYKSGLRKRKGG